jgi:hypothetical protein
MLGAVGSDAGSRAERLSQASEATRRTAHELRHVSARIVAALDELKHLERESRKVRVGSAEFELLSAEIAARAKAIFALANEEQLLGDSMPPTEPSIEDFDDEDALAG